MFGQVTHGNFGNKGSVNQTRSHIFTGDRNVARGPFSAATFVFVGWKRSSCHHRGFEAGSQPCSLFYFSFWAGFISSCLISRGDVIDVVAASPTIRWCFICFWCSRETSKRRPMRSNEILFYDCWTELLMSLWFRGRSLLFIKSDRWIVSSDDWWLTFLCLI